MPYVGLRQCGEIASLKPKSREKSYYLCADGGQCHGTTGRVAGETTPTVIN